MTTALGWIQFVLNYIWKTVIIQIMAESLWEIGVDCLNCISLIPMSVQVVASSFFEGGVEGECLHMRSVVSEDPAAHADEGEGGITSGLWDALNPSVVDSVQPKGSRIAGLPSFLWFENSMCDSADLSRLRDGVRRHIGAWFPLTFLSTTPNGTPPRWPSKSQSSSSRVKSSLPSCAGAPPTAGRISSRRSDSVSPSVLPFHGSAAFTSKQRHKVLVLDLDETLIYAATSTASILVPPDFSEVVPTMSGAELYHVWERPFLQLFLSAVSRIYNVVVFTASAPAYADPIIDRIDRGRRIRRRLYRCDCTAVHWSGKLGMHRGDVDPQGATVKLSKDLVALGVPLSHVVLLDNSACCVAMHPDNGVVVPSYSPPVVRTRGDRGGLAPYNGASSRTHSTWHTAQDPDEVLLGILPFLEALACVQDVRSVIARSRPPN